MSEAADTRRRRERTYGKESSLLEASHYCEIPVVRVSERSHLPSPVHTLQLAVHTLQLARAHLAARQRCKPRAYQRSSLMRELRLLRLRAIERAPLRTLCVHLGAHLCDPLRARHELRLRPRMLLHSPPNDIIALCEVHRHALRLLTVEWRVDEDLDAVALGVLEVERDGVAVAHRDDLRHPALGGSSSLHLTQAVKAVGAAQGDLVDGGGAALLTAGAEHQLMVLLRVPAQEHEGAARERAPVSDREPQHSHVEVAEGSGVGREDAKVGEGEARRCALVTFDRKGVSAARHAIMRAGGRGRRGRPSSDLFT